MACICVEIKLAPHNLIRMSGYGSTQDIINGSQLRMGKGQACYGFKESRNVENRPLPGWSGYHLHLGEYTMNLIQPQTLKYTDPIQD